MLSLRRRTSSLENYPFKPYTGTCISEETEDVRICEGLEPCQTALVAGGLVRLFAQNTFSSSCSPLPFRLRQLQNRLASVSDIGWIGILPSSSFKLTSGEASYCNFLRSLHSNFSLDVYFLHVILHFRSFQS